MTNKMLTFILLISLCVIMAGCVQSPSEQNQPNTDLAVPSPSETVLPIEPPEATEAEQSADTVQNETIPGAPLITPLPTQNPATPVPTTTVSSQPTKSPNVVFMEKTLLSLDDMQGAKEGLLLTHRSGDMVRVNAKARELRDLIRKNGMITGMPAKMDYVRLNYYEYTDQASQFAQTFIDGSDRWLASDKASANSYFDAGIMAASRADIADKRIRKFFEEHVLPVQG